MGIGLHRSGVGVDKDDGEEEEAVDTLFLLATVYTYWLDDGGGDEASAEGREVEPRSSRVRIRHLPCLLPHPRLHASRWRRPEI